MSLATFAAFAGGVGLFLLGMRLLTNGLKVAAGPMLRGILARWTRGAWRGLVSGVLVTGLVQSSSAVTVAAIGFVNAGLLPLRQAIWVIFGSNVGTTMTGWLVATIGLRLDIEAFALPLIGLGMAMALTGGDSRRRPLGDALAGFGLFFLGISVLENTFSAFAETLRIEDMIQGGWLQDAVMVAVGIALTFFMQSSSAAIALALTAAEGGILSLETAAAIVVGANIGTTTTAVLAAIGATPNAKRVAASHLVFNVLTGIIALLMLPVLVEAIHRFGDWMKPGEGPAEVLALFHTSFNLLGVLLMWPIANRLIGWLELRFLSIEEVEARPRHLDNTAIVVPALGIESMRLELRRVALAAAEALAMALGPQPVDLRRVHERRGVARALEVPIDAYGRRLLGVELPTHLAEAMSHPYRALQHLMDAADTAGVVAQQRNAGGQVPAVAAAEWAAYLGLAEAYLQDLISEYAQKGGAGVRHAMTEAEHVALEAAYETLKRKLLQATVRREIGVDGLDAAMRIVDGARHGLEQLRRAVQRLDAITDALEAAHGGNLDVAPDEPKPTPDDEPAGPDLAEPATQPNTQQEAPTTTSTTDKSAV